MFFCYGNAKGGKMLEYLRNASDKPWAKFLMFVLIFSFVGWGAAEWLLTNYSRDTTILRIGHDKISIQQFNTERQKQLNLMSKEDQRASYTDPVKSAELTKSVITTLTMNQLASKRAKDLGFFVSDKRIAKEIRQYPEFQNKGEFSPMLFDYVLRNNGMTEQEFADVLRTSISRQMAVGASSFVATVPDFAVVAAYNARYAKRDIKYSTIKFSNYKVNEPTEEQLQDFYKQTPKILPETRSVSYVFIATDMDKPDAYDAGYKIAQQVEDMIISGDTMETAAKKHKVKYAKVSAFALNSKVKDAMISEGLSNKIFAMDSGVESELLELKKGFMILRVDEIIPEHNADFKDVRKELVSSWKYDQQRKQAYVQANEMLVTLNQKGTLANSKNVAVTRTDNAPLSVLNAAFANKIGTNSIVEDKDCFYVLRVEKEDIPTIDKNKKANLRKELEKLSARYMQEDYVQFLKRLYPIKFNEKTFNRFYNK